MVAQKELEEKTDIYFEIEEIKEGKRIVKLRFIILSNLKNSSDIEIGQFICPLEQVENEEIDHSSLLEQLDIFKTLHDEYKITKKIVLKIVNDYSEDRIRRNIEYTQKEYKVGNINKNFVGYLVDAITKDYANTTSLLELDANKHEDSVKKEKQLQAKREYLRSKISLEFSKIEKEKYLNSLSESEQDAMKNKILEELKLDSYSVNLIKKKGLRSPVAGIFIIKHIDDFEKKRDLYIEEKLKEAGL